MKLWRVGVVLIALVAAQGRAADVTAADLIKEKLEMSTKRGDKDLEEIEMMGAAKRYAAFGMAEDGKKIAEKITDDYYRGEARMGIGKELLKRGDMAGANEMLTKLDKSGQKNDLARAIAVAMAKKGQLKEAEALAVMTLNAEDRERFIGALRAAAGDVDGAQKAVDEIKNADRQDEVRKAIVANLCERGDIDAAEKFASAIKTDQDRVDAAARGAVAFFTRDKKKEGERMLAIAREGAKDRKFVKLYPWPLGYLGMAEAMAGNVKDARRIFKELPERDMIREDAQWETVLELVKAGEHEHAQEVSLDLTMLTRQMYFRFEIAKSLAKSGEKKSAKSAMDDARHFEKHNRMETEFLAEANTAAAEAWVNGVNAAYEWSKKFKEQETRRTALGGILDVMQEMQDAKK